MSPRRYGDAPLLVDRAVAEPIHRNGDKIRWGDAWWWRCMLCDVDHNDMPLPGSEGRVAGADGWPDAMRLGLLHLRRIHPRLLVGPDCLDGKHRACGGLGWNETADMACDCPCKCHDGAET